MKTKFSLRMLLIVSLILGAAFGISYQIWTAPKRDFDRKQAALARVGELRGTVLYSPRTNPDNPYDMGVLRELSFAGTVATDHDLVHAVNLEPRELLDLRGTKITDSGLQHLYDLRVEKLDVRGTSLTDEAIVELQKRLHKTHIIDNDEDPVLQK